MNFSDKFSQFPMVNLVGWCVVIGLWIGWEIYGATHFQGATFTYLLRTTCSSFRYGRMCLTIAWLVLGWHFLWYDSKWWKAFMLWLRG